MRPDDPGEEGLKSKPVTPQTPSVSPVTHITDMGECEFRHLTRCDDDVDD
jgi:hypothetical protein